MKTIKLTDRQRGLLSALQKGAKLGYMPYMGRFCPHAYFYLDNCRGKVTAPAKGLIKLGLVSHKRIGIDQFETEITEQGKSFDLSN